MINPVIELYKTLSGYPKIKFANEKFPNIREKDYKNGFITRYFFRQVNNPSAKIIEVDKKQWVSFQSDPFYIKVKLDWLISGDREYVYNSNLKSIITADKTISGIRKLLENNLLQFYK